MTKWIVSKEWKPGDTISGRISHWQINNFTPGKSTFSIYLNNVVVNGSPVPDEYGYNMTAKAEDWFADKFRKESVDWNKVKGWRLLLRKEAYEIQGYNGTWHDVEAFVPVSLINVD